jgi:hypothetical protein
MKTHRLSPLSLALALALILVASGVSCHAAPKDHATPALRSVSRQASFGLMQEEGDTPYARIESMFEKGTFLRRRKSWGGNLGSM